jgi:hypothetical protein
MECQHYDPVVNIPGSIPFIFLPIQQEGLLSYVYIMRRHIINAIKTSIKLWKEFLRGECKLWVFENTVLKRLFLHVGKEVTEERRKNVMRSLINNTSNSSSNCTDVIKSKRVGCACNTLRKKRKKEVSVTRMLWEVIH